MQNLNLPAFPFTEQRETESISPGFTKLEYASLLIAQGMAANSNNSPGDIYADSMAKLAVSFAKAVLEEANK